MKQDKEIKSIQNEKEEVKLPLFKIIWYYTSNISKIQPENLLN